jgi:hypothetical protein
MESIFDNLQLLAKGHKRPKAPQRYQMLGIIARRFGATKQWPHDSPYPRRKPNNQRELGDRFIDRAVSVMEPGKWYGRMDIIAAMDKTGQASARHRSLMGGGYITRQRNPKFKPILATQLMSDGREPKWLYGLTEKGETLRSLVMLLA